MAFIDPKSGKAFERDPEEGNIPTGLYLCELTRVSETGPSAKFPGSNNRLVFEFTVNDPNHSHLNGKKAVTFVGKTLLKSKEGRESNLVKLARMMGVVNPENGFDPDSLIGRKFNVMIEYTPGTNGEAGRGWARSAMAAGSPVANAANQTPPTSVAVAASTTGAAYHAGNLNARWDYSDGGDIRAANVLTGELQEFLTGNFCTKNAIRVKPAGSPPTAAKYAEEWGFTVLDSQIPW